MESEEDCTSSLVGLLQSLEGETTTIELRDETTVHGKIVAVDRNMNTEMLRVTYIHRHGEIRELSRFFVSGKQIRYVHIPEEMNIGEMLKKQLQPERKKPKSKWRFDQVKSRKDKLKENVEKKLGKMNQ